MYLFLGAFKGETKAVKKACVLIDEYEYAGISLWIGSFNGERVLVAETGTGKLNAAIATCRLLEEYEITAVICIGIAGGLRSDLQAGDLFIADSIVQHDMDVRALGFKPGETPYAKKSAFRSDVVLFETVFSKAQASGKIANEQSLVRQRNSSSLRALTKGHYIKTGTIGTGDVFVNQEILESRKKLFEGIDACDMESYAIARVCDDFDVPFISAKTISDLPGQGTGKSLREILPVAAENTNFILHCILTSD